MSVRALFDSQNSTTMSGRICTGQSRALISVPFLCAMSWQMHPFQLWLIPSTTTRGAECLTLRIADDGFLAAFQGPALHVPINRSA